MVRSLLIIALAIVCGAAAAIGVNQTLRRQTEADPTVEPATESIFVAVRRIGRGQKVVPEMIREVQWPRDLVPAEAISSADNAVGRVALSAIMAGEPLFNGKLTAETSEGFIASIIKPGMRAYTIQTRGPSATVAGFVRPRDRVDILVNIRGSSNDATGGGSTTTLLQAVEILAIDQILDPDADAIQMLEMWTKGDDLTSVTLEVTPAQASLLALGQSYGELSLALRSFGDELEVETPPATIRDIESLDRFLKLSGQLALMDDDEANAVEATPDSPPTSAAAPPITYIQTFRGSESGRVDLFK